MARVDRASNFLKTIEQSTKDLRAVIEALRIFGYINEIEYSELNTELTILSHEMIRTDRAETIEFARTRLIPVPDGEDAVDVIPGMIPREY